MKKIMIGLAKIVQFCKITQLEVLLCKIVLVEITVMQHQLIFMIPNNTI